MNLLHVCAITNNKTSGISNVVPEHFINQQNLANVAILNCNNEYITRLENQKNVYYYKDYNNISILPKPFNKPDIVIFHGIYIFKYIGLYKYCKKNNIPYVIIPHGSLTEDAQKIKPLKKLFGNIFFFNKFIMNCESIQYLSENEEKMSSNYKHNSFVLGNGMIEPNFEKESFSKKGLKLVYVGRYAIYHKGLDILIKGCLLSKDIMKKNNIKICLYGSGNDGIDKVKNLVLKNGVNDIISVNGPIFDDNKTKTILENDFFVQLSRLEGQPLGIMEAMFLGMPIICSEGTTFGDIVRKSECGYVCSTPEEFAKLIVNISMNEKVLKEMSKSSKYNAKKMFSWEIVAHDTIKKYKEIIRNDRKEN